MDIDTAVAKMVSNILDSPTEGDLGLDVLSSPATKEAVREKIRKAISNVYSLTITIRVTGSGKSFHVYWNM